MSVRDLIPWGRSAQPLPASFRGNDVDPFLSLHRNVNRLFDEMLAGFDLPALSERWPALAGTWPKVEISENEKEIRVSAELPGLEEKDVEILLDDNVLTLRGETRTETEDKDRQFSERYYGRFERRLALGCEVDRDKVGATFKNGMLSVTLPKSEKARSSSKRIAINDQH